MNYYYSATMNAFYPVLMKQNYIDAGSFPDDAKEIEDNIFYQFSTGIPPLGKMRIAGDDGLPTWADIPPPTQEELIQHAEVEKQTRLQEASKTIAPLQDAADLGIAMVDETTALKEWKKYRVLLNRVDTSAAPDIKWPEEP
ncbi:tail fiber assembly protein [Providencia rettgeri]|uniref:tail fiber assembly protein n=1 Tax=Providencia rettgeri TaxID=587 RepID=UPI00244C4D71|nr:tail fiber assembly protein [Providencia rettgeri]MDH2369479.1 tail fiber assembly protein [Providencia rettgeri]